jgi:hypothetical protein
LVIDNHLFHQHGVLNQFQHNAVPTLLTQLRCPIQAFKNTPHSKKTTHKPFNSVRTLVQNTLSFPQVNSILTPTLQSQNLHHPPISPALTLPFLPPQTFGLRHRCPPSYAN